MLPDTPLARWIAAAASFLLPGLGYLLLGEKQRALCAGIGVMTLFVFGLLVGGVSVLDGSQPNAPFVRLGQRFLAPAMMIDAGRRHWLISAEHPDEVAEAPTRMYTPAYGRMQEQGVLFTSIAGFLNLMMMIDLATRSPAPGKRSSGRLESDPASPKTGEAAAGTDEPVTVSDHGEDA